MPYGVGDVEATGERWALQETRVKLVACVPRASFAPNVLLAHWDEDRPVDAEDFDIIEINPMQRGRAETVEGKMQERRALTAF